MNQEPRTDRQRAEDILRGAQEAPEEILKLTERLKDENAFGLARKILACARAMDVEDQPLRVRLAQQHALCTYKDPDLPAEDRLDQAEAILEEEAGTTSELAASRRREARAIREDLVATLPPLMEQPDSEWLQQAWWFFATVAEAYFGLGHYDEAGAWLEKATELPDVSDWEYASTAQQLALLATLQKETGVDVKDTPAWNALKKFLGDNADAVQTVFAGKVGLALSGGGFRASLYHIGVLAKLAELDMLRHVEVLSCVSGGSIIGAYYYLEVRKLLQEKSDHEITHQDYIDLVQRIRRDFLAGVQRNVRVRVAAGLKTNFKMLLTKYSRTERMGELYESEIFSRIDDGEGGQERWLNGLYVTPKGTKTFHPKYDNWRRRNKVPTLILNATTLNTGHNWQFTASWMGEPPASIDTDIDGNYLLRRMYYKEAPPRHQKVRLGHAVGASSCVPGLFPPLALAGLYPDKTVRLVDGGVHDNQGVVGLLEQDCTVLLVSDSSGQMGTVDHPGSGLLGVPLRSNSILMARVREAEYHDLKARRRGSLLRGFLFVHLKKDLSVEPVDWIGAERFSALPDRHNADSATRYGVQKDVQQRLAAIRTDLDSFCDAEAYALMTSGYRMTEYEFDHHCVEGFPLKRVKEPKSLWRFLAIEPAMTAEDGEAGGEKLRKLLTVAESRAFKAFKLSRSAPVLGFLLVVLAALDGIRFLRLFAEALKGFSVDAWEGISWLYGTLGWILGTVVLVVGGVGVLLAVVWLIARLHLLLVDRLYLRWCKVEHVVGE